MDWQPTYPAWATSVYASTLAAILAASVLTPLIVDSAAGWGLQSALALFRSEGASGPGLIAGVALLLILLSVPPGLLSLFLIALTDTRLALHPLVGGVFFGAAAGLIAQSPMAVIFGFIFGSFSVGGTAAMLALQRHFVTKGR